MLKEYVRRFVQHLLGSFLFDAPGLVQCKMFVLRRFFDIGPNSYLSYRAMLVSPHSTRHAHFSMGRNVGVEHDCELDYSGGLKIGDDVWISEGVFIATHGHRIKTRALKKEQPVDFSGLTIGNDAWLGARAVILPSVSRIGTGAVIGACCVVTKDVEDWAVVVGNPARVIGYRT